MVIEQAIDAVRQLASGGGQPRGAGYAVTIAISVAGFVVLALVQWLGSVARRPVSVRSQIARL